MTLTQAEMEASYDAERNGSAYIKPDPTPSLADVKAWIDQHMTDEQIKTQVLLQEARRRWPDNQEITDQLAAFEGGLIADALAADEEDEGECPNCTPDRDCPACTASYEAERQQVHARAAAAETATERATILLENCETLDGDQIFDLILDDRLVSFTWYRCIDWVLWRQAHGLPVKRCGTEDDAPAAINARYDAARLLSSNLENYRVAQTDTEMQLLCMGEMIERWERTPEQEAQIQRDNQLVIEILEAIEAHYEKKRAAA